MLPAPPASRAGRGLKVRQLLAALFSVSTHFEPKKSEEQLRIQSLAGRLGASKSRAEVSLLTHPSHANMKREVKGRNAEGAEKGWEGKGKRLTIAFPFGKRGWRRCPRFSWPFQVAGVVPAAFITLA